MKQMISLLLLCCVGLAVARYVAIPVEDVIDFGELTQIRLPREVESYGTGRGPRGASHSDTPTRREYVDFGAHSGSRGSYGWYVDFPVHKKE